MAKGVCASARPRAVASACCPSRSTAMAQQDGRRRRCRSERECTAAARPSVQAVASSARLSAVNSTNASAATLLLPPPLRPTFEMRVATASSTWEKPGWRVFVQGFVSRRTECSALLPHQRQSRRGFHCACDHSTDLTAAVSASHRTGPKLSTWLSIGPPGHHRAHRYSSQRSVFHHSLSLSSLDTMNTVASLSFSLSV